MIEPRKWTREQLSAESEKARNIFREARLSEPLEIWKRTFDEYEGLFTRLLSEFEMERPERLTPSVISRLFEENLGDPLRYLAGPPISADDLRELARTSLAPSRIAKDANAARRIIDTILLTIDPKRFPWIVERRSPTPEEKNSAILASAVLITAQRVATNRRNESKENQESSVKSYLDGSGLTQVPARTISNLSDAPAQGQFCGESLVGSRKADIIVRMYDGRLMPIECKVSNSSTNSVKRLNNDAQVKARLWLQEFGTMQVVPAAVLSGVYKVHNLLQAQDGGLILFWSHRLSDMKSFIEKARP